MTPILSLFDHPWTVVTNLHLFGDKESHHAWLFARCHQQLMEPARSAAHPQQSSASAQTQSSSLEKVSKPRFWLCNYLFSYNCRFSCIIRPINIKFFLLLPYILNDAVRSQKEGKWYQENPVGRGALCGWVRGQAMQRLWPWCTLQTQNNSDDCHSLALHTEMAPRQLQTQISPGKPSMHGSIEMAWGHLQTSCSNGKGSNLCWVQLFGKKKITS